MPYRNVKGRLRRPVGVGRSAPPTIPTPLTRGGPADVATDGRLPNPVSSSMRSQLILLLRELELGRTNRRLNDRLFRPSHGTQNEMTLRHSVKFLSASLSTVFTE